MTTITEPENDGKSKPRVVTKTTFSKDFLLRFWDRLRETQHKTRVHYDCPTQTKKALYLKKIVTDV